MLGRTARPNLCAVRVLCHVLPQKGRMITCRQRCNAHGTPPPPLYNLQKSPKLIHSLHLLRLGQGRSLRIPHATIDPHFPHHIMQQFLKGKLRRGLCGFKLANTHNTNCAATLHLVPNQIAPKAQKRNFTWPLPQTLEGEEGGGPRGGGGLLLWLSAVLIHPCPQVRAYARGAYYKTGRGC